MEEVGPVAQWLITYGYIMIFPLIFIEGNLVAITVGFLAALGYFNIFYAGFIFMVADLISNLTIYHIGSTGHSTLLKIKKIGRLIRRLEKQSNNENTLIGTFYSHFEKIYVLVKMLPIPQIPTAVLLAAGFFEVSVKRVIRTFLIIEPLKVLVYMGFGYFVGVNLFREGFFGSTLSVVFIIVIVFVIGLILWGRRYLLKHEGVSDLFNDPKDD